MKKTITDRERELVAVIRCWTSAYDSQLRHIERLTAVLEKARAACRACPDCNDS